MGYCTLFVVISAHYKRETQSVHSPPTDSECLTRGAEQFDGHRKEWFPVALCCASWWDQSSAECTPVADHYVMEWMGVIVQDDFQLGKHPPLWHHRQRVKWIFWTYSMLSDNTTFSGVRKERKLLFVSSYGALGQPCICRSMCLFVWLMVHFLLMFPH